MAYNIKPSAPPLDTINENIASRGEGETIADWVNNSHQQPIQQPIQQSVPQQGYPAFQQPVQQNQIYTYRTIHYDAKNNELKNFASEYRMVR